MTALARARFVGVLGGCAMVAVLDAHKGATAKFTYNEHVHAVFAARCGGCHADGGVGPMSLLSYDAAYPWAEALRVELLAAAAAGPAQDFVRAAHQDISARELDVILDWATGGAPQGDPALAPTATSRTPGWPGGAPDAIIELPPHVLPAGTLESTHEVDVRLELNGRRRIARFDVLPGTPAVVRSVNPMLRMSDGLYPLGTWVPRQHPLPVRLVTPVIIEPGARLTVRLDYKKSWKHEQQTVTDQSQIGLYFVN